MSTTTCNRVLCGKNEPVMKQQSIHIFILSAAVLLAACQGDDLLKPYGKDDGAAPAPVSNVRVRNYPGGATIRYDLPDDADLAYVRAEFTSTDGARREVRASQYVDSLVIEGFGDTREYTVDLYACDHFENRSTAVPVTVHPETPPVFTIFESLRYTVDFGGFLIEYDNPTKSDIAIYVMQRDAASGDFEYYDAYYTRTPSGTYAVRGLPDTENEFGIYVRDRYNNYSETLYFTARPYREDALDKTLFQLVRYPGDTSWAEYSGNPVNMWDGQVNEHVYAHTGYPVDFPHCITIDLGVDVRLSRMHEWQRSRWEHGSWRYFKVYGCAELPAASDDDLFAGWTLLGDFESIKPSGRPLYEVTDEDLERYAEGEDFPFMRDIPVVRYVRIAVSMSWSGMLCSTVSEVSFWGDIQDGGESGVPETNN